MSIVFYAWAEAESVESVRALDEPHTRHSSSQISSPQPTVRKSTSPSQDLSPSPISLIQNVSTLHLSPTPHNPKHRHKQKISRTEKTVKAELCCSGNDSDHRSGFAHEFLSIFVVEKTVGEAPNS
ncbi:hypothetical protein DACRYDRAFT_106830 [Dacryopinax primogenitus]|uniref:Uncharacterized protein n=1 Tax=Dacryopinax primogenitus (strain DJM 731) TaxID=1858805 RepID=M5GDX3_DACPD|nr:uncharacterized protein DACRYDRAFT_106830 [Dacryopinax primogenitus]EJU02773.1 hypothetical protein DACRYDRAFT_106830 [Dacryopinax primogenitus]